MTPDQEARLGRFSALAPAFFELAERIVTDPTTMPTADDQRALLLAMGEGTRLLMGSRTPGSVARAMESDRMTDAYRSLFAFLDACQSQVNARNAIQTGADHVQPRRLGR